MAVRLPSPVNEAQYIEIMDDEAYDGAVIANSLILYTGKFKHDALPEHGRHDPNVYMPAFKDAIKEAKKNGNVAFAYSFTDFSENDFHDIVTAIMNRYTDDNGTHIAAVKIERDDGGARALVVVHFTNGASAAVWQSKCLSQVIGDD
ncbi:hypothetical protein HFN65_00060 [Rhizobium laguerreae]|uniref:hypothetical protein n=1 Tax=Rhizobium TaxID=379 RepID=UPI000486742A|nr:MULTISPECIES: hypothetical protein [Rhizobium]MBY3496961.1 hypothetical protein [Rhizobium laguerreae]MBY3569423.1 hypothetical protein [Rhizobium laguerreae]